MGQMPDFAYDLMLMIGSGLLVPVVCHGMVAQPSEVTWGSCAQLHHLMQTLHPGGGGLYKSYQSGASISDGIC